MVQIYNIYYTIFTRFSFYTASNYVIYKEVNFYDFFPYKQDVGGSSPSSPTMFFYTPGANILYFHIIYNIKKSKCEIFHLLFFYLLFISLQ